MSELRDITSFAETVDRSFDELEKKNIEQAKINAEVDAKLRVHDGHFAKIDQAQATFENQIEIFRTAIKEQFEKLRRELSNGR